MESPPDPILSHHIFMCPFRIETINDSKFDLKKLPQANGDWDEFKFEINTARDYSERIYFYDYVYDALFWNDKNSPLKQYGYKLPSDSKFILKIKEIKNDEGEISRVENTFNLSIENIALNFYESSVAVLSFHLSNLETDSINDIKLINDFGRRIYPPFLNGKDKSSFVRGESKPLTFDTKSSLLPDSIKLSHVSESLTTFDNFDDYDEFPIDNESGYCESKLLPPFISKLLEPFLGKYSIGKMTPLIDDRMFVLSWINSSGSTPSKFFKNKNWKDSETWHNLIFCDGAKHGNQKNKELRQKLNIEHTLPRWSGMNTLYGVSRFSLICFSDSDFALPHIMTMYFQMTMLVLVQKASILKFSSDATNLASSINSQLDHKGHEKLKELQVSIIRFINRLHFRDITAQDQGTEIYDALQKHTNVERNLKELNQEIHEMINLVELQKSTNENKDLKLLTIVATLFLPASLIVGLLGMTTMPETKNIPDFLFGGTIFWPFWISCFLVLISLIGTGIWLRKKIK